jgi:hypothetical protein
VGSSQRVFHIGSNLTENIPNPYPEHYLLIYNLRENAQANDLAPFFGDLSQSQTLSEIKIPLK